MNPAPNAGGRLTRTLPGRFYHDPAIWQLEQERLFARLWVSVGREDPELVRLLPAFRSGATQEYGLGTRLADDAESLTVSGRAPAPPFPGLAPEHERHYYGMVVRPNMLLNLLPDHVIIHTLAPLAPDRSRVTCDWLFARDAVDRPGFDAADTVALFDRVNRQDWEVCEWVQASVRSRAFAAGGVYVPIERHLRGFNDWVLEQLGLPAAEPAQT